MRGVYCVHGHEVGHGVADRLRDLGLEALLLEGGIEAWKTSGRPVTLPGVEDHVMKWVTRERPKIDRVACPWLIARFIDRRPEFIYVPSDQVLTVARGPARSPTTCRTSSCRSRRALRFDAFLRKYELDEPEVQSWRGSCAAPIPLGSISPQARGLLALSLGLSALFKDDHEMLRHGMVV